MTEEVRKARGIQGFPADQQGFAKEGLAVFHNRVRFVASNPSATSGKGRDAHGRRPRADDSDQG
jgi:hypothetical protein